MLAAVMPRRGSPMIKLVYCFAKRPDLSLEEFSRYWRDVHGPIGARIPGVRRLVQSVAIHEADDVHPPSFDGMAELWFDDLDAVKRARSSAEWQASTADERHFIDHARTAYFLSHERTLAVHGAADATRTTKERLTQNPS
jgi:uncharacterized protein (TIGR02118 family)